MLIGFKECTAHFITTINHRFLLKNLELCLSCFANNKKKLIKQNSDQCIFCLKLSSKHDDFYSCMVFNLSNFQVVEQNSENIDVC